MVFPAAQFVPREREQLRIVGDVDVFAPHVLDDIVETRSYRTSASTEREHVVDMHAPQATAAERMVKQVVDVPMPGVDPIIEVPQLPSNDRVSMQAQVIVQETPAGGVRRAAPSPRTSVP